jgi:hypothetical protein
VIKKSPVHITAVTILERCNKLKKLLLMEQDSLAEILSEQEKVECFDQSPNVKEYFLELETQRLYMRLLEKRIKDLSKIIDAERI